MAIIGTGMTGLEAAEMLIGHGCRLTLVEMLTRVGPGMLPMVVDDIMGRVSAGEPRVLTGHRLDEIRADSVRLTRLADDTAETIPTDCVVLAAGVRPRSEVTDRFASALPHVYVIGDAAHGGRILDATQDAYGKASVFDGDGP